MYPQGALVYHRFYCLESVKCSSETIVSDCVESSRPFELLCYTIDTNIKQAYAQITIWAGGNIQIKCKTGHKIEKKGK